MCHSSPSMYWKGTCFPAWSLYKYTPSLDKCFFCLYLTIASAWFSIVFQLSMYLSICPLKINIQCTGVFHFSLLFYFTKAIVVEYPNLLSVRVYCILPLAGISLQPPMFWLHNETCFGFKKKIIIWQNHTTGDGAYNQQK